MSRGEAGGSFSLLTEPWSRLAPSLNAALTLNRLGSGRKQKGALTVDKKKKSPSSPPPSTYCDKLRPLFVVAWQSCIVDLYFFCDASLGHSAAPLRAFLLIVIMRFDYLSTQVITVHLLPPLPVSDHSGPSSAPPPHPCFFSSLQVEADWLTGAAGARCTR